MKETHRFRIHGFIKTLSPVHIASPIKTRYIPESNTYGTGDAGIACTTIQRLSLPILHTSGKTGKNFMDQVPVYTANNLNGALRRTGAAQVIDALQAKGQQINMETYSAMTCGAVTGKPDGEMVKFEEYREAQEHPFVGLFGGGPRLMNRHVRIHNMVPMTKETEFMFEGVARHPALDGVQDYKSVVMVPEEVRLVQVWTFVRNDDVRNLVNLSLQCKAIENFEEKILERQALILEDQKAKQNKEEGGRFSTWAFSAFEFLIPGVYLPMTFELDVTDEQLGLFLLALDRFAETERIGGKVANGFGQFSMEKMVLTKVETNETSEGLFLDGRLNQKEDSPAAPYLKAWNSAAKDLSAERLNYLMRPPAPKKEKKKGAKEPK